MELWIRSQDRIVLMKIDTLSLAIDEEGTILGYGTDGSIKVNLANYKTKERALEVLDEIQKILTPKMVYKNITKDKVGIEEINQYFSNNVHFNTSNNADIHFINNTYVYEMPEK